MFRFFTRYRLGWSVFVFVLLASVVSAAYYLYQHEKRTRRLYTPKLTMFRIDEVPFPRGGKKPVDVMADAPVTLSCESVMPPAEMGSPDFRFFVGGKTYDNPKGKINVSIPGEMGSVQKVALDYILKKPDGSSKIIDHYEALVRITQGGEYFRIHAFGNREGKTLASLTVPREVIPYTEAAVKIYGDPEDYAVLFFVEAFGTDSPVLQASSHPRSGKKFEPIIAPFLRYRSFGTRLGGYAAWPSEPIQIGEPDDARKVFEVYAGIFETKKVKAVVDRMLSYEGTSMEGQVQVKVNPVRRADVKALAWRGMLSEPVRVVRAPDLPPEPKSAPTNP